MVTDRGKRSRRNEAPAHESTCEVNAVSACAVCEKAVVTDTNEPGRQDMHQEAAEELVGIQVEQLLDVAVRIVAIAEADAFAVEGDDPGVADGDAVGVVGQIGEHLLRSTEGRLAVDNPVGCTGAGKEQIKGN